jgi:hypothetical protein
MIKIILLLLSFFLQIQSLKVCVIGASSGLGRELIYQGINDFEYNMIGVTNSTNKVCIPYRGGGLDDKSSNEKIISKKFKLCSYLENVGYYDAIIFTTGGTAFENNDYSDKITMKYLQSMPQKCKSITLISAYGVGYSINNADLGIVSMKNWYLKDVYRAKQEQENMVNLFHRNIKKQIYRPKVLSYGNTNTFKSTSRQALAKEILLNL